ncbi:hypothetical protein KIN20_024705 [Parelaphostrongylus tenuis]|uniref:Uncharacterized protein n=1 Tax=Parelaphostrongylus tenuis TaxID=148309 RepID=A0AAD5MXC5_PARTN|nr:hypothetical protein KIN20_024705 [Parelaphostrongylus tenuis]
MDVMNTESGCVDFRRLSLEDHYTQTHTGELSKLCSEGDYVNFITKKIIPTFGTVRTIASELGHLSLPMGTVSTNYNCSIERFSMLLTICESHTKVGEKVYAESSKKCTDIRWLLFKQGLNKAKPVQN